MIQLIINIIANIPAGIIMYFRTGQYAIKNPIKDSQISITVFSNIYLPPFFLNLFSSSGVSISPAR